jgi:uncharacterized protein
MMITRRTLLGSATGLFLSGCGTMKSPLTPKVEQLSIYAAGQGSAFLPYAQGLASFLTSSGLKSAALESTGSIENIRKIESDKPDSKNATLGTVFLGTAFEAVTGTGSWTAGHKHSNLRALFPMYETSFQIVTIATGLNNLKSIAGKRVGVGPAGGPAESFFKGLLEATGLKAQIVTGTPTALASDLTAGRIDALWQGAALPIPAIKQITDAGTATVFGLSDEELAVMLKRFAFLSPATIAANTYKGQSTPLKSVAAWNFVMCHKDLTEDDAYFITRSVLSTRDPTSIHTTALPTRKENATNNSTIPFHAGALKFYVEQGIVLTRPHPIG